MGAQIITTAGIKGGFYSTIDSYPGLPWVNDVSMEFQSSAASETYGWIGQSPAMAEWVSGMEAKAFRDNNIILPNKEYVAAIKILRKEWERDSTGQVMLRVQELAQRAQDHWATLLTSLISAGTGSTLGLCYDGQYFFDTDHSEGSSGTQLNLLAAAQVDALNVATAAAPTPAEAVKAVLGVIGYMLNYKDDVGQPMNSNARKFTVMCGTALWAYLCPSAVGATVNSGDSNTIKDLAKDGFDVRIVFNPSITSTTVFYVFRTDAFAKPFIRQTEIAPTLEILGPESEEFVKNNQVIVKAYARRAATFGFWQYAAHATLS